MRAGWEIRRGEAGAGVGGGGAGFVVVVVLPVGGIYSIRGRVGFENEDHQALLDDNVHLMPSIYAFEFGCKYYIRTV